MRWKLLFGSAATAALLMVSQANAAVWTGTAYYTYYPSGSQKVDSVAYTYNDATHSFSVGTPNLIANLPGADGLLFAPGGGHILVGGQGPTIYNVDRTNGTYTSTSIPNPGSYHLTLNGTTLYTSGPYYTSNAPLVSATVGAGGALSNIQSKAVTGDDTQLTQLAFAGGKVFYVNSQPNCCGNVGTIDLSTGVTTRFASNITSAHGLVDDPYTGLIDLFGGGWLGSLNPATDAITQAASGTTGDFDQGAPDGFGHALIAGSDGITFVDYRSSGDITHPDFIKYVGGFYGIDDIAPLAGAGSLTPGVPEPATWAMMLLGFLGLGALARRRRTSAAI